MPFCHVLSHSHILHVVVSTWQVTAVVSGSVDPGIEVIKMHIGVTAATLDLS